MNNNLFHSEILCTLPQPTILFWVIHCLNILYRPTFYVPSDMKQLLIFFRSKRPARGNMRINEEQTFCCVFCLGGCVMLLFCPHVRISRKFLVNFNFSLIHLPVTVVASHITVEYQAPYYVTILLSQFNYPHTCNDLKTEVWNKLFISKCCIF